MGEGTTCWLWCIRLAAGVQLQSFIYDHSQYTVIGTVVTSLRSVQFQRINLRSNPGDLSFDLSYRTVISYLCGFLTYPGNVDLLFWYLNFSNHGLFWYPPAQTMAVAGAFQDQYRSGGGKWGVYGKPRISSVKYARRWVRRSSRLSKWKHQLASPYFINIWCSGAEELN